MASLFDSLNSMPILEGRSDEDKRSALLQAGLAMMQAPEPGGGPISQISGGIQAGLQNLDYTEAKANAAAQQQFQNTLATQGMGIKQQGADSTSLNADTNVTSVANQAAQAEATQTGIDDRFDFTKKTDVDLKKAEAEWLRRRWTGPPSGAGGSVTKASLDQAEIHARMGAVLQQDPEKYTLGVDSDGKPRINEDLLMTAAFNSLYLDKAIINNPDLAFILKNADEGGVLLKNLQAMQTEFGAPKAVGTVTLDYDKWSIQDWQAILDSPPDNALRMRVLKEVGSDVAANKAWNAIKDRLNIAQ